MFRSFQIFRIPSNGGTEKVLNFSVEEVLNFFVKEVLNFLGTYWKSTVKVLIFGQPVLEDTLLHGKKVSWVIP